MDDSPDAAPAPPRAAALSEPWGQLLWHVFQMALKTCLASAALSLTAWLLITSKSTATQARTQGGEGEGRGEQGRREGSCELKKYKKCA